MRAKILVLLRRYLTPVRPVTPVSLAGRYLIPDLSRPTPLSRRGWGGPHWELVPFDPQPLELSTIVNRPVEELSRFVGTYGAGGYGYFGIRFGTEWLVISIGGADNWIFVNDKLASDWFPDGQDALTPYLLGSILLSGVVNPFSLEFHFSNGAALVIDSEPNRRPIWAGSERPRCFAPKDDLRRAVFLSPTDELWIAPSARRK